MQSSREQPTVRENEKNSLPPAEPRSPYPQSGSGHHYGSISLGDAARAQIGDTINHYYAPNSQKVDKVKILLASLTFDRMDTRFRNIAAALPTTCEWLTCHERFVAWSDISQNNGYDGFLWVKGKPGSGKSTIMRQTLLWAEQNWTSQVILSYFFNARSPFRLEKSSLGLYRSLLYQLLHAYPKCQSQFRKTFNLKLRDGKVEAWSETELQNFFIELVATEALPALTIFIDALDEGDIDDVQQMVAYFRELGHRAAAMSTPLRICLSSRHYPNIDIDSELCIILEDQSEHTHDVQTYLCSKLRWITNPKMAKLRQQMLSKSAGVFLWVVLVTPVLNRLYSNGTRLEVMMKELDKVPNSLQDLFFNILTQTKDEIDECITLLRSVLVAMRPLSSSELYASIQQIHRPINMPNDLVLDNDFISKYLLQCSRGLIEVTKYGKPTVQFIHETIREALMKLELSTQLSSYINESPSSIPIFQEQLCHEIFAGACLEHLLNICTKVTLTDQILQQYPLAIYAAQYWWQHMREIGSPPYYKNLNLALSLILSSEDYLLTWVRLYRINDDDASLWVLESLQDLGTPIYYAAATGIPELVSAVLLQTTDINSCGGLGENALLVASRRGHEKVVRLLLDADANVNAAGWRSTPLEEAARRGYTSIVYMLLDSGADVDIGVGLYGNPLMAAVANGEEHIVRALLSQGANVNVQGRRSSSPLHVAIEYGREDLMQILLDAGADPDAVDRRYGTPIQMASELSHDRTVKILLNRGANVNAQGGGYGSALQAASRLNRKKIVQMLLEHGAHVNAQCGLYGSAIKAASKCGHEEIVQLLLVWGAVP